MKNITAFKIHNKYKYFIHFLKKPYLCKTINPNLVKLDSKTPITTNNLFKEISKL